MRLRPQTSSGCFVWVVALTRVGGGGLVLWWLGAPAWAVAAWLMVNVRVRIGRPPLPSAACLASSAQPCAR